MNKKGVPVIGVLIVLVIALVSGGVLFLFLINIKEEVFSCNLHKQVINEWVVQTGLKKELTLGLAETNYPPVSNLCEPLEIKNVQDFNPQKNKPPIVHKAIADTMVDCWNAFGSGEIEFLSKLETDKAFCFPCRAFIFSDEIKQSHPQLEGLNEFLKKNKPYAGKNIPTYAQLLTQKDQEQIEQKPDIPLDISDDLYVYYYATTEQCLANLWTSIAWGAIGGRIADDPPSLIQPIYEQGITGYPFNLPIIGGYAAAAEYFFIKDANVKQTLLVGNPETIRAECNRPCGEES